MRDPPFPAVCALALVLLLLALPTHMRARNSGTLLYIGWSFFATLFIFVNSLVWSGNISDPAPVWCDISAKIAIAWSVGLPAASLCINRRLYQITHPKYAYSDGNTKRRTVIFDLSIGLGLPVLVMILHIVVRGHRYNIIEDIGCYPTTYMTLAAVPLVYMWPILIGFVSLFYSFFTIGELVHRRRQFSTTLSAAHSGLNASQYFRLMALAATDLLFSLPMSLFVLITNLKNIQIPWISWADTHQNFWTVKFMTWQYVEFFPPFMTLLQIFRWSPPAMAIVFFIYFGVAGEATADYCRWFWAVAGWFGIKQKIGPGHNPNWSNRLASNPSASRKVSIPSARPTNSLDRALNYDVESQLQSRDSLGFGNNPDDQEASKPSKLK
ncbi:hypothetical protein OPQ81_002490 [Rhizoctonia solani]|nr:hypothetical protein OPQ81_002490 [Rhizoctonia solani]